MLGAHPEAGKDTPVELQSAASFDDFIRSFPIVVIHFRAKWNKYDEGMMKTIEAVGLMFAGRVMLGSVDVDREEMWPICSVARVLNIPALSYYVRGVHVGTVTGLEAREKIADRINHLLAD